MATKPNYTVTEAAKILGVSRQRVRKLIELGTLVAELTEQRAGPAVYLLSVASVEAFRRSPRIAGRPKSDTLSTAKT